MTVGATITSCVVNGVQRYDLHHVLDPLRGHLAVANLAEELPFKPQRWFVTWSIPTEQTRGQHAHRECSQFLVCVHGSCRLSVDDGRHQTDFRLDRPTIGVLVPPMVWAAEYEHTADSVLLVLASHAYDPGDYIREYSQFLQVLESPVDTP